METGPSAWWDQSWNVSGGCRPVDLDCAGCYAAEQAGTLHQAAGAKRQVRQLYDGIVDRIDGRWEFNGRTTQLPPGHPGWTFPLVYPGAYRPVLGPGQPSLIFVGDMSDLFFRQPTWVITKVVGVIAASRHIGLLVTRRPGRMRAYFTAPCSPLTLKRRLERLWLGFSAGFQEAFDARWPHLRTLAERGWLVFVSIAPLREPVVLPPDLLALGERAWVIVAGQQGRHEDCRPMDVGWARAIRDQCGSAGIPFFFKQLARKAPIPIDLMIRQFPRVRSTSAIEQQRSALASGV